MAEIRGTLRHISYSGRNFWSVAKLEAAGGASHLGMVTITGRLMAIEVGDSLELTGQWVEDPKYGQQFKFNKAETLTPCDDEGVVAWLTQMPDLGRARAIEVVRAFGADKIWDVIEHDPQQLTAVSGITPARAEAIRDVYLRRNEERDLMVFLKRWGLTDWQCGRVIKEFGANTEAVMRDNPYRLSRIDGFGFKTVDQIAQKLGVPLDHIERARAAAIYMLQFARDRGNTYIPMRSLIRRCIKDLEVPGKRVREASKLLLEEGEIVVIEALDGVMEEGDDDVYLTELYQAEGRVADLLANLRGK